MKQISITLFIGGILGIMIPCTYTAKVSEKDYSISDEVIVKSNFVILTGCSGGGKSALLGELAKRGYNHTLEPGRQIVKEQLAIGGKALPWKDLDHFLELALSRCIYHFNSQVKTKELVFFDRGIVDTVQLNREQGTHFDKAAKKFKYHKTVFMLPPWKDIYRSDKERKHSFEQAVEEYEQLLTTYKKYGYTIVIVPKDSVSKRADMIILDKNPLTVPEAALRHIKVLETVKDGKTVYTLER